jgi:hypothetical protein
MVQYVQAGPPGNYNTVVASSTAYVLSNTQGAATGKQGDFLERLVIIPATATPGAVTLFDGADTVLAIPAGTTIAPYFLDVRAYSDDGAWSITTGTSVSVMAIGQFS